MEPEGSLPHSQVPATYPILSQLDPIPTHIFHFRKIHLNIIRPSTPGLLSGLFLSRFLNKPLYGPLLSPIRAICPAQLVILDLITRIIFVGITDH